MSERLKRISQELAALTYREMKVFAADIVPRLEDQWGGDEDDRAETLAAALSDWAEHFEGAD